MTVLINLNQGDVIGPYRLETLLGQGAFKQVWRASRTAEPASPCLALAVPFHQDRPSRLEIAREVHYARQLDHPNIVRTIGLEEHGGIAMVVMEYLKGDNLAVILRKRGRLAPEEAAGYVLQVCRGLKLAHDNSICHRDIKPANVLVTANGDVKILDFGLARAAAADVVTASRMAGTLRYMAPEALRGAMGKKSDVWSLGVMLYELVMGDFPFDADNLAGLEIAIKAGTFLRPSDQDVQFPEDYEKIILGCLERDPARRSSTDAVLDSLEIFCRKGLVLDGVEGDLELRVRAGFPLIYIVSYEEERVQETVERLAARLSRGMTAWNVVTWSLSQGLRGPDGNLVHKETLDPLAMLSVLPRIQGHVLFLLKDFHPYLESPVVVRALRDLAPALARARQTAVIVSPVETMPRELEKTMYVLDFGLPDVKVLDRLFARLVRDSGIEDRLRLDNEGRLRLLVAASGLTWNEAENAFSRAIIATKGQLTADSAALILEEKRQILKKSDMLEFTPAGERFADVGGLDRLKSWFRLRLQAYTSQAREFGLPYPRGLLLAGVPGCGKSLSARALAAEWGAPLLRLDVGRLFSSMVGATERNLRRALAVAESIAPCVLWIDEIEKGFGGTGAGDLTGVATRVFGAFLTWLQEKTSPVFVVATANRVVARGPRGHLEPVLPPELLRKGRLDEIFFVDLPDARARASILDIHLRKRSQELGADDISIVAEETPEFSGAELEFTVISALFAAFALEETRLTPEYLLAAAQQIVPLARQRKEDIELLRGWSQDHAINAD